MRVLILGFILKIMGAEKIILGTVQLGLPYGINNSEGKPNLKQAFEILAFAKNSGVLTLDTAEAYGNAIKIIGKFHALNSFRFQIISKFKYVTGLNIKLSVQKTLQALHIDQMFAYLLHNADQLLESEVKEKLNELKSIELIKYAGVSVYSNEQFEKAIFADHIDVIQIPYNILDNNNLRGQLMAAAKKNGKIIHVRSVFLQGLFFMKLEKLPPKLIPLQKYLLEVHSICKKFDISVEEVALNYVMRNESIDGVLTGVESSKQLIKNLNAINTKIPDEIDDFINRIIVKETELLNPANWN